MPTIRIQEHPNQPNNANATLIFDHGAEYPITITDPFSPEEEENLEWYFEDHLQFPFLDQVKASQTAASITTYGETLFKQVFADPKAYLAYAQRRPNLSKVQFEIAGSPSFHRWHWEALKDPDLPYPMVLQSTMIRQNLTSQVIEATMRPSPTINLLIVTARPFGKQDVGYRTISRPLVDSLRQAKATVQIDILRPGTYKALENHLRDISTRYGPGYYHGIHFDLHGAVLTYEQLQKGRKANRYLYESYGHAPVEKYEASKAFLFFEDEKEPKADPVEAAALANLLLTHQVPITILNACQSGKQVGDSETSLGSRLMQAGVQLVLAMGYSVTVTAAELLMRTLYQQLFADQDLSTAIRYARTELYNRKGRRAYFNQEINLEDWLLPVVYQNQEQRLAVRPFTHEESEAYHKEEATRYTPRQPSYGFVGRDLDILQIEKRLLTKRNLLLIRGMGGAGKTTLLQHLASWWQTTGLIEQVFYFGYDDKAWTRQQIMNTIAKQLLTPHQYRSEFQPLDLDAQQSMLTKKLRSEHHLLILDNLESITGSHLAIQHTLRPKEQTALHRFLTDLAGGLTLVLLGSRSSEDWLSKDTFADNVYDLPGLDPEAASTLADRILERHNATKYRQDKDFQKLLKLLDGFPLALEVVLANLAHQTPANILAALQAGDVTINVGDSKKRTENILRCIDYSHSNLSPEAQQLLLCLAPFTSVINLNMLDDYTDQLKQQPALSSLPFDRWPEVLQEAQNWGLLSPDPDVPIFLRLQPILPYFLRNRLGIPEQAEARRAIEAAFRELFDQAGATLLRLLFSKDPQERLVAQVIVGLEYENLVNALYLVLADQVSLYNLYGVLTNYLDTQQDQRRGLELGQTVLSSLEVYPAEKLVGQLGSEFARVIGDIALRQLSLKQYADAEASLQKKLKLVEQLEHIEEQERGRMKAMTYHNLGMVAQGQRQWEQAGQYYQQALQICMESNDRYNQARIYHQLGMVAQEQRQWEQAGQYYQQALQIEIEFNDRNHQASTYHQLGYVAQEQQQWEQAEQYYQQALQITIEFNDRYAQASTYHNLGIVAQEQRQWEQAGQYYQRALQIKIESNDRYEQAKTYIGLGRVAQEQRQWEQAGQYYQQALQIEIEFNDRYEQASTYHQLGRVAQEQRQWEQAEQYYQRALQIKIEFNDRYAQASTYHQLGMVAEEQRQWEQARKFFLQALETYVAYKDTHNGSIALRSLARLWQATGDTELPAAIASIISSTSAEVEALLRERLEDRPAE
jgi:tetratricopeptide (TPR) repeat protein